MKNNVKKTVAMLAAATMALSAMSSIITVSADTTTTATSQNVAEALAKVKYNDTSLDIRQTYNAATASVTYNIAGKYAVRSNGKLQLTFNDVETKGFKDGILKNVKITVKSGNVTTALVLVANEDTATSADDAVLEYKGFDKLFTADSENEISVDIKEFPDTLQSITKSNKNVAAATMSTKTGMQWDTTNGWDINNVKIIDNITVEFNLEQQTAAAPTKKELSALGNVFEDATMVLGSIEDSADDIREYTITADKLYIAAKYDAAKPVSDDILSDDVMKKIEALEGIECYAEFKEYVDDLADEKSGTVIRFAKISDAIADYIQYGLFMEDNNAGGPGKSCFYDSTNKICWYDGGRMSKDDALTAFKGFVADPTTLEPPDVSSGESGTETHAETDPATDPNTIYVKHLENIRDITKDNVSKFNALVRAYKLDKNSGLNSYIENQGYRAVIKDTDYGYVESNDLAQNIANYSTLTTALSNIANEIASSMELANVKVNTRTETDSTVKTNAIAEIRPLIVTNTDWTNIGMLYTNQKGTPILAQLNSLIGNNRGCKLIFTVDPSTLPANTANNQQSLFGMGGMSSVGAARLRVNGAFALTYNDMASFDTATNTYTFDWDAVTAGKTGGINNMAVWSLEFAATNPIGLVGVTVSVPDQEAYLAAIGVNTDNNDNADNADNKGSGSLSAGEGTKEESDTVDEDIQIEEPEDMTDEKPDVTPSESDNKSDEVGDNNDTADTSPVKDEPPSINFNPNTGNRNGLAGVFAVMTCAVAAIVVQRKKFKG